MATELLLAAGDRVLYRTRYMGMLHEGLIREVSKIAYKIHSPDGVLWLEKSSIQVVELLPKQQEKGEKDAKEDKRIDNAINDA